MKKGITVVLAILFLLPIITCAQSFYSFRKERSLLLTGGLGTSSYFGDLKDPGDLIDPKGSFSIGLQHYFFPRISARSELSVITMKGDDKSSNDAARQARNLSFKATNFELNTVAIIDLAPLGRRFYQRPKYNAYAFAGIGLLYMNPKAELDGQTYALQPLQTEDVIYSRFQFVMPYGLGARMRVSPFFNIGFEGAWRLTFTDYIDDVSTVHPDKTGWDPVRTQLSDRSETPNPVGAVRGDPKDNDGYFLLQLKIEYYLPENFLFGDYYKKLYTVRRKAYRR